MIKLEKSYKENKDITISTVDKRTLIINKMSQIKEFLDKIDKLDMEIKIIEIERDFWKRMFEMEVNLKK